MPGPQNRTCEESYRINMELLRQQAERIKCLSVENEWFMRNGTLSLVNLWKLTITTDRIYRLRTYDMSLLPNLTCLDIHDSAINYALDFSRCAPGTVRVKYLNVCADGYNRWMDVVMACVNTLTTLTVRAGRAYFPLGASDWSIRCPLLEHFVLQDSLQPNPRQQALIIKVFAPSLIFYENHSEEGIFSIEFVTSLYKVVHVRTNRSITLERHPKLRILQLEATPSLFIDILEQLEKDWTLCAHLETIVMVGWPPSQDPFVCDVVRQRLAARDERAGRYTDVLFGEGWARESPVDQYECGVAMACRSLR